MSAAEPASDAAQGTRTSRELDASASPRTLRLIVETPPLDGARNMALDRAIQLERNAGRSPSTLRLYRWARPTVTTGRFQRLESVDLDACRDEGVDVARRFTGGRGVLHDDELTYSIVASVHDGVPRGTAASYRHLCTALVDVYRALGVDADLTSRPRGSGASGACYLHATHADVSAGALKLSGSAQVWHHDTVLQHGSFVVRRDIERESRVFRLTAAQANDLAATTATFEDLGVRVERPDELRDAVVAAFGRLFGMDTVVGVPTVRELEVAESLLPETTVALSPGPHT